jgi:hypothetical protein
LGAVTYSEESAKKRWEVTALPVVRMRRQAQSTLINQCIEVANRYNADIAVPVLGNDPDTAKPVLSPALINEAIDVPAIRASATNPTILCPWLQDHNTDRARATNRRKLLASTYYRSNWDRGRRRFFRHIAGYGMGSIVVIPDDKARDGMPLARVSLRNPLTTYADPQSPEELDLPADVGFVHQMSGSKLRRRYPRCRQEYGGEVPPTANSGDAAGEMWDVLEWVDDEYVLIGIMGRSYSSAANREPIGQPQLLSWYPNRTGLVPAIVPTIITLDKIVSRLTHMIGKADLLAYLWQLDIAQAQKSIAPDRYVIAGEDEEPQIVSNGGHWIDGRTGNINLLKGVKAIGELRGAPDPGNLQRMQMLERNARQETGLVGPVGGETGGMSGSLRTGRGIDSLMSAAVDPAVAELQEIGGNALTILNEAIFACYQEYWPNKKFTVFSGWAGDRGLCTFTPSEDIDTRANQVYYPLPGTDAYAQTVQLSQMVQAEMMSPRERASDAPVDRRRGRRGTHDERGAHRGARVAGARAARVAGRVAADRRGGAHQADQERRDDRGGDRSRPIRRRASAPRRRTRRASRPRLRRARPKRSRVSARRAKVPKPGATRHLRPGAVDVAGACLPRSRSKGAAPPGDLQPPGGGSPLPVPVGAPA